MELAVEILPFVSSKTTSASKSASTPRQTEANALSSSLPLESQSLPGWDAYMAAYEKECGPFVPDPSIVREVDALLDK